MLPSNDIHPRVINYSRRRKLIRNEGKTNVLSEVKEEVIQNFEQTHQVKKIVDGINKMDVSNQEEAIDELKVYLWNKLNELEADAEKEEGNINSVLQSNSIGMDKSEIDKVLSDLSNLSMSSEAERFLLKSNETLNSN